ncbi:hypothetical protein BRADI_5g09645v3 [Brachypodium distachyon]|uniref:Myb/SANT-like domain-containing protein n=1 Tax=Brachypodium distachyon TaxID=15368 RepID=A0A0Q3H335_BRADI|nr:hypothetical protein BRADI_5g09645v3 [Brachypodium distachyon]
MAEAGGKKFSRNYVQWTPEMDHALLDVLVEHHNNGDHAQNGWKAHVYNNAIKDVREKCGVDVTKEKIVSRCKTFDKHYDILSKILAQANEKAAIYKNKVIYNWHEICIVYSEDKANGEGARTGSETEVDPTPQENAMSSEMKTSFNDALKTTEPLTIPQGPPTSEILAALNMIPRLSGPDKLRSYSRLIQSERKFRALMDLSMDERKEWLLLMLADGV